MLKITKIEDIRYRIRNLQEDILQIVDLPVTGYRKGRLAQMESELRFLEGLLK